MKIKKSKHPKKLTTNQKTPTNNEQAVDASQAPVAVAEEQTLVDQAAVTTPSSALPPKQVTENDVEIDLAKHKMLEAEEEKEEAERALAASKASALTPSELSTISELSNAEAAKALSVEGDSLMNDALAEEASKEATSDATAKATSSAAATGDSFGKQHPDEAGFGILGVLAAGGAIAVAAASGGGGGGGGTTVTPILPPVGAPSIINVSASTAGAAENPVWSNIPASAPNNGANNVANNVSASGPKPSSAANGVNYYNVGDVITFAVTMSETVTVTGQPTLAVNIGNKVVNANYSSKTVDVLYFTYTIQADDAKDYLTGVQVRVNANSISLNKGTIVSATGVAASISHGATLETNFVVDTTPPVVPTLGFEPVPASVLTTDNNHITMPGYISGKQAQGLATTANDDGTFSVAVTPDTTQGAFTITAEKDSLVTLSFSRLTANGSDTFNTIFNTILNTITKTIVGTGASQAVQLTAADLAALGSGKATDLGYDIIQAKVSSIVDLAGNALAISNSNVFIDATNSGDHGAIRFKLDTTAPTVSSISTSLGTYTQMINGVSAVVPVTTFNPVTLNGGQTPTISYTYKFSEAITGLTINDFSVTQTASDGTSIIPIPLNASMLQNPSGDGMTYILTVTPAPVNYQTDTDTLIVALRAGAVIDAAGNPVAFSAVPVTTIFPPPIVNPSLDGQNNLIYTTTIDTLAPIANKVTLTAGSNGVTVATGIDQGTWYNTGDVLTMTLTMDEAVLITGTPQLTLSMDGVVGAGSRSGSIGLAIANPIQVQANYVSGSGTTQLVFTYTVLAGQNTDNGVGVSTLALNGGKITDLAGNNINLTVNVATGPNTKFNVDTKAPSAPSLSLVSDTGSSASDGITNNATIQVTGLEAGAGMSGLWAGTTWYYQVDGGLWTLGGNTNTPPTGNGVTFMATSGTHTYSVLQVDQAGNTGVASTPVIYNLDTTGPVATSLSLASDTGYNHSDGLTNNATINVLGLETAVGTTWKYQVDGSGNWIDGTGSTLTATNGVHSYVVQQTDVAGNPGAISLTKFVVTLDTAAPVAPTLGLASDTGSSASDGITNNPTVNVTGLETLASGASWHYQVDGGGWLTGGDILYPSSAFTASGGTHTYSIRQIDAAGNVSATTDNIVFTVDQTSPSVSSIALTKFTRTPGHANRTMLGKGDVVTATVTMSEALIVTGTKTTDANSGLDIGVPQLALTIGNSVYWANYASGSGTSTLTFVYTIQTGQLDSDGISIGVNSVRLNGGNITDLAGNVAVLAQNFLVPDDGSYKVDSLPPPAPSLMLAVDSGSSASDGVTNNPTVNVLGLVAGNSWQFQVDTSAWSDLRTTGNNFTATAGAHSYSVRQIDGDSTTSVASTTVIYNIDTMAIAPTLSLAVDTGTSNLDGITSNPTINVSGLESGATWQYQVDGVGAWLTGGSVGASSFLATAGAHNYLVRQTDLAGNVSPTGNASFTLNSTEATPYLALASDTGASASDGITSNATVNVLGLGAGNSWQIQVDGGTWETKGGSSFVATAGPHTYSVRQIDVAGITSAASAAVSYTIDTTAPATATLALAQDTGTADGIITNNPIINVLGLEAGATWQYQVDGVGSWTTGAAGISSFYATAGTHSYFVRQTDVAGNVSVTGSASFNFDSIAPSVSSIALTGSTDNAPLSTTTPKILGVGDVVTATITMSENVVVTGAPQLALTIGGSTVQASYVPPSPVPTSGSSTLTFTYVILAGQTDNSGISIGVNALRLNGGSIADLAGNSAVLAESFILPPNSNFKVQTSASVPSLALLSDTGISASDGITTNATVNVLGLVSDNTWEFKVDTSAWQPGTGSSFIAMGGAHSYSVHQIDLAGNTSAASSAVNYNVDITAPTVTASAQGVAVNGNAQVQSNSEGVAYLVKNTLTVNSITDITSADTSLWNSVVISSANTNFNLPALGLQAGTYKVYAQDVAGNLSVAGTNSVVVVDTPALTLDLGTVNVGTVAAPVNLLLHLINPVIGSTGSVYYYLDANADGIADSGDSLTHDTLDSLLHAGNDTTTAMADRSRTITQSGVNTTIVLPTIGELISLYNSPISHPPTGWSNANYWAADLGSAAGNHLGYSLTSGGATGTSAVDTVTTHFVAFQVL